MIKSLKISNIALIDEVKVDFTEGFNVFTGETGAGKSIIIDAIMLLLGGKFDKCLIKEGSDVARVEALFEISDTNECVIQILNDNSIEYAEMISLARTINVNGRSEYRINGDLTTMNVFKKISNELIDIFGQHENLKLLDVSNHIQFLDMYIGSEIQNLKNDFRLDITKLANINNEINCLGDNPERRAREIEFLEFEINDIESKAFVDGEEEDLLSRKLIMANGEKIHNVLKSVIDTVETPSSMVGVLKNVAVSLGSIAGYDESIDDCRDRINSLRWELNDIVETISDYVSGINYSVAEYESVLDRLDIINDYKRKYGNSVSAILGYLNNAKNKLDKLRNCDEELCELKKEKQKILESIYSKALMMHNIRIERAKKFQLSMVNELQDLGMQNAQFVVDCCFPKVSDDFESLLSGDGLDKVEFLFSANLGQSPKSLDKIISGGELSRFALSFKTVVNNDNPDKTLIFDEVDAGIGGNTGSVVGKKLTRISRLNQILCITHLAQIASFADSHYKIVKSEDNNRTYTTVYNLDEMLRREEISRMIGSIININYANLHSNELINESYNYKLSLLG